LCPSGASWLPRSHVHWRSSESPSYFQAPIIRLKDPSSFRFFMKATRLGVVPLRYATPRRAAIGHSSLSFFSIRGLSN
jgi:hypothetical protein